MNTSEKHKHESSGHGKISESRLVKDPVCGMNVNPQNAKGGKSNFSGHDYFFCSPKCKVKFDQNPMSYLKPQTSIQTSSDAEYTCPMHPQIRQIGPGSCPICGMSLEPVNVTLGQENEDHEYKDMRRRFWVGVALSLPLLFITMGGRNLLSEMNWFSKIKWLEVALSSPVVLWGGWPFYVRFWQSIKNKNLNILKIR
jgi:P-type Cu+ transporter